GRARLAHLLDELLEPRAVAAPSGRVGVLHVAAQLERGGAVALLVALGERVEERVEGLLAAELREDRLQRAPLRALGGLKARAHLRHDRLADRRDRAARGGAHLLVAAGEE